jgi:hypothetical protein
MRGGRVSANEYSCTYSRAQINLVVVLIYFGYKATSLWALHIKHIQSI